MTPDKNGWNEYSKYVINELSRMSSAMEEQRDELIKIKIEISTIKAKAAAWGTIAGLVTSILMGLLAVFYRD